MNIGIMAFEDCKPRNLASMHFCNLDVFFDDQSNFDMMYSIVQKLDPISLRMCEFICTDMARNGLVTKHINGSDVYLDAAYQEVLESKGKAMFDVFKRNKRTIFVMDKHGRSIETNLAQVRFFEFAIKNGVIVFARKNFRHVESLMSRLKANSKLTPKSDHISRIHKRNRVKAHACFSSTWFEPTRKKVLRNTNENKIDV